MNKGITKEMRLSVIIGYGVGNIGYGLISQLMSVYLVFYSTAILKMPGSLIGLVIAISVVWDAVSDPVMGYLSDHTVSRFGRRHPYIILGAVLAAATNLMLWRINADQSMWLKFIWILLSVLLIKTFLTVFITPYSALGAELSTDYDERSVIQAIKTAFFLGAIFFVSSVSMFIYFRPTLEYPFGQLNPAAYQNIAMTASVLMLLSGIVTYASTKSFIPYLPSHLKQKGKLTTIDFVRKIKFSLAHKDYRAVFFGYLFTNLASAIIYTIGLHTYTYTFHLDAYKIGIVLGTQLIVSIIAQPIWAKISEKIDKKNAVKLGLKISVISCLILFGMTLFREAVQLHYEYLLIYSVAIGFGTSVLFSIPLSMIADTVDQQEHETGERNEGVYYGMLTFGYKLSQALAIFALGIILDFIRFDAALIIQQSSTEILLGACLSLGSIVAFLLSGLAYRGYSLDEKSVKELQAEIKSRDLNIK